MARLLLVALGFALILYVLWRTQEVLFLLFVAVLLATACDRAVGGCRYC